ncbi:MULTISPECIES: WD40/YVTN/BNR-like repeat-containing protein [Ramlibacter]|uniref:Glycosyl hydrolase n=1 Tax=Ramlibacter pinisoli TaxID=2682844 RepID=A0A6N8IW29_9BURK|nr:MULTISPECIES: YCF48-related protein [Ramlibacter]MBA2965208.1 glycosyl hydrolase [Ramlibacter sp. CGMCC 1.13660]MVQ30173.1 glycosyl hydrolase [Ramlibacter pinisoli]
MNARHFLMALAAGTALAGMAATGAVEGWADVLDTPAMQSPLASRGLVTGLAQAGNRVVAVGQRGHILWSDNAGQDWQQAKVPVSSDLVAVHFPSPDKGWAVGHDGVILHSTDGGKSWQRQRDGRPDEADVPLLDVWFGDESTGWAVGAFGTLLATTDGGANWKSLQRDSDNPKKMHLYAVRGIGSDLWIAGEQGLLMKLDRAGGRFAAVPLPYQGTLFGVAGSGKTLLVHGLRGNLLRSTDGGANWQAVPTGLQVGLTAAAVDAGGRIVLASQAGHLLTSADQGASFSPVKLDRPVPAAAVLGVAPGRVLVAGPRGLQVQPLP